MENKEKTPYVINDYICEKDKKIINQLISSKKKDLLVSPMKTGKTKFVFTSLANYFKNERIQLIFVSPKTALLKQVGAEYNLNPVCDGADACIDGKPIITTPDSLRKAISKCMNENKKFYMVYDEAHELELSYNFRRKLIRPIEEYENPLCIGLLCMTATPDNIIESMAWDNIMLFTPINKFIQAKITNLVKGVKSDSKSIANYIIHLLKNHDGSLVFRVNSKEKIKEVEEILKTHNIEAITWHRGDENSSENNKYLSDVLDGKRLTNEIILTTSLIDEGVEILADKDVIICAIAESGSRLIELIQFVGRFRQGVKEFNLLMPNVKPVSKLETYSEIEDKLYKFYNVDCMLANDYDNGIIKSHKCLKCTKVSNVEYDLYEYEIDPFAVSAEVFERFINQYISDPEKMREYLKNHFTFNSEIIRIVDQNNLKIDESIEEVAKEIKENKKIQQEEFENEKKKALDQISEMPNKTLEVLVTKEDLIDKNDLWIKESIKELYEFYHSEEMRKYRKLFYDLQKIDKTKDTRYLLLRALDDDWIKEYEKQELYIKCNRRIEKGHDPVEGDRLYPKVNAIRKSILNLKGKEINVKLSKKFMCELLEECRKEKCLSKVTGKTLEKHLSLIYNSNLVTDKNIQQISSVKTKYAI